VRYIDTNQKNAANLLGDALCDCFKHFNYDEIVVLCIGTDRATGDSLGPLCGYKMIKPLKKIKNTKLYGTLEYPVHAKNLSRTIDKIYIKHKNPLVLAIDASLGTSEHIGYIAVSKGSLSPGTGVNKSLPKIGDISITGIVNFYGITEMTIIQNTRLNVVMKIAETISDGICIGLARIHK